MGVKVVSDSTYWREAYRTEADENHRIRQALGVDPADPDETLTARTVKKKLRDEYERGVMDGHQKSTNAAKREVVDAIVQAMREAGNGDERIDDLLERAGVMSWKT